jgi:DNA-binding winged helix-turn-helix (wHTH) protein
LRYRFEEFAFDIDRRELHRGAEVVPITPQVFDLLDYLIRNRERVVSKDELISAVWLQERTPRMRPTRSFPDRSRIAPSQMVRT